MFNYYTTTYTITCCNSIQSSYLLQRSKNIIYGVNSPNTMRLTQIWSIVKIQNTICDTNMPNKCGSPSSDLLQRSKHNMLHQQPEQMWLAQIWFWKRSKHNLRHQQSEHNSACPNPIYSKDLKYSNLWKQHTFKATAASTFKSHGGPIKTAVSGINNKWKCIW